MNLVSKEMDTDVVCVLCGGPFALEQHIYNINPDKEEFQVRTHVYIDFVFGSSPRERV